MADRPIPPMPDTPAGAMFRGFQGLTANVVGALRSIFGGAPDDNELPAYYPVTGIGTGGRIVLAATVGNQASGSFTVDAGSDFICTRITSVETDSSGVILTTLGSYLAQMQYTGNARNIVFGTNGAHTIGIYGNGQQSVPLAKNWLLKRSSVVTVTLTNQKAVAAEVYVIFHGWSVIDMSMVNKGIRR